MAPGENEFDTPALEGGSDGERRVEREREREREREKHMAGRL